MDVKVDTVKIKTLRLAKSWSQEVLAEEANLSLRTIQRMELDGSASLKSRLAVAQALDVEPGMLDPEAAAGLPQDATADPAVENSLHGRRANRFSYPGSYSMSSKVLTPLLIVLWALMVITGGLLVLITVPLAIWNMLDASETLSNILLANIPLLVVFLISVGFYEFFRRFRPRTN